MEVVSSVKITASIRLKKTLINPSILIKNECAYHDIGRLQALYWEYPRSMPCATESQISRKPSLAPVELAASGR